MNSSSISLSQPIKLSSSKSLPISSLIQSNCYQSSISKLNSENLDYGHSFRNGDNITRIDSKGIVSNINDNKNALIMLEAIKDLLIKNNCFTQLEFNNQYIKLENQIKDIELAKKVADELVSNCNQKI